MARFSFFHPCATNRRARPGRARLPLRTAHAVLLALLCALGAAPFYRMAAAAPAPAPALTGTESLSPMILTDTEGGGNLAPYVYLTRDPDSALAPGELARRHMQNLRGQRSPGPLVDLGFDSAPVWIVFAVHNNARESEWALSFGTRGEGRLGVARALRLYEAYSGKILYDTAPLDKGVKPSTLSGTQLPLRIEPGATALYLLWWVPEPGRPGTLDLELRRASQGPGMLLPEEIGLFVLVALASFFAAVTVVTRSPGYLAFMVYFGAQFLSLLWFADSVHSGYHGGGSVLALLASVASLAGIAMARIFFEPGREDFTDNAILMVLAATVMLSTLLHMTVVPQDSPIFPLFMYAPPAGAFAALMAMSFLHARKGKPGGYAFALSWGMLLAGHLITGAALAGYVPLNAASVNAFALAVAPQAFLLIAACRDKFARDEARRREVLKQERRRIENMARLRQAKDAADQGRLLRVLEREREIMAELREREAQRAEEMRQARNAADEANRAKSAFLAVVSHEIRTPMTGIMGMVRLMLGTGLSTDQKEYVRTIQDSGDAMLALLNDILDFEKIESGKMDLEIVDFELPRLVHGVVTLMSGHAADKKIALAADIESGLPAFVRGDPTRIRQVLLNLVNNAIKFTSKGGVTVAIRHTESVKDADGTRRYGLYFAVRDTGVGISEEAQRNLFKPFIQADSSVARKYGGTGLGLAICKRLIEAMGGSIGLESRPEQGSTFHFTLQLAAGQAAAAGAEAGQDPASRRAAPDRILRILVVDDNEINRKVLTGLIGQSGHKTRSAPDAATALDLCARETFDLVFMDIEMPEMRGDEAVRVLRALPDTGKASVPVIALTGNVGREDVERYYQAGMNGFVAKPVDPATLQRTLDKAAAGQFDNPVAPQPAPPDASAPASPRAPQSAQQGDPPRAADPAVFNEALLASLRNALKSEQVTELLDGLLVKTDELVEAIIATVREDNMPELTARAHELKGMAGNFGLVELSALAASLEKGARSGQSQAVATFCAELPAAAGRGRAAITAWMGR